jgi:glycosyltransferase involved in cell wall biosynthesis
MRFLSHNKKEDFDLISISHYFYPRVGGLENMAFNLISGLTEKGLNSLAIYGSNKRYSTTINGFQAESFKTYDLFDDTYPIFGLGFIKYVFKSIRNNKNAKVFIHSRHLTSSFITALICILLGHPYTVIEHNAGPVYFKSKFASKIARFIDRNIFSLVHRFAENVISVSNTGRKWVSNTFNVRRDDITVVYNGYDSKEIRNNFKSKENIVVWAAKWIEVKDPSTALRGFIKTAKKYPDWKFYLIGRGDALKRYNNIPNNVEIIPEFIKQEDLFRLLRKSKVYVNSSLSEGLALGILEATAFGNVPVLSNAPSNKEVAKKLKTKKFIFSRKNAADLSRKLISAIDYAKANTDIHRELAKVTRNKFSNENMVNRYYSFLFPKYLASDNIKKLSIVIPAYNEQNTILSILKKVVDIKLPRNISKEIIIVNDCSTDKTGELINIFIKQKFPDITFKYIENDKNVGKSQTVKHGVLHSTGDLVVVQDADLEYVPQELSRLVEIFLKDPMTDVVYGNRFNTSNEFINLTHLLGNKFVTFCSNLLTRMKGFKVKDMETCYKMGRGELMRGIFSTLESKTNFGLEPEVTAKLAMLNVNVKDCNISYIPRSESEGKKMRWFKHGLEAINEIFKYNILLPKKEYSIKTIEKNI